MTGEEVDSEAVSLVFAGLRRPLNGKIMWAGKNIWDDIGRFRRRVRYLSEIPELFPSFTVRENLSFYTELFNLKGTLQNRNIDLDNPEELASFLSPPDCFAVKLITFLLAKRPLLICAYLLATDSDSRNQKFQEQLRKALDDSQLLITFDNQELKLADRNLYL